MATTQYIGSRYVPLFADPAEWSKENTYEPLTIVLHEGNSYTSRQFVPVGIDIENDAFWAETGNYNAQVEQYRQEVLGFREETKKNAAAITAETEARESADATLTESVESEATAREAAVTELEGKISAESTARETAISEIDTAYKAADSALESKISAETTARETADETLTESVAGIDTAYKAADSALESKITAETTAREEALKNLMTLDTLNATVSADYDSNSNSFYTVLTVPRENVTTITQTLKSGYGTIESYVNAHEGIFFSGALSGPTVSENVILQNEATSSSEYWCHINFDSYNNPSVLVDINRTQTGSTLSATYKTSFCAFSPIIVAGTKYNTSVLSSDVNYDYIINWKQPRAIFAWDTNNFYFVLIEGRNYVSIGATFEEEYALCTKLGFTNAVNMDGGFSNQIWIKAGSAYNLAYNNGTTYNNNRQIYSIGGIK